jgi:hypothetical protein
MGTPVTGAMKVFKWISGEVAHRVIRTVDKCRQARHYLIVEQPAWCELAYCVISIAGSCRPAGHDTIVDNMHGVSLHIVLEELWIIADKSGMTSLWNNMNGDLDSSPLRSLEHELQTKQLETLFIPNCRYPDT